MRNVFILGAGSSFEYGMPLWEDIPSKLGGYAGDDRINLGNGGGILHQSRLQNVGKFFIAPNSQLNIDDDQAIYNHLKAILALTANENSISIDQAIVEYFNRLPENVDTTRAVLFNFMTYLEHILWILMESIFIEYADNIAKMLFSTSMNAPLSYRQICMIIDKIKRSPFGWFTYYYNMLSKSASSQGENTNPDVFIDFNYDDLISKMLYASNVHKAIHQERANVIITSDKDERQSSFADIHDISTELLQVENAKQKIDAQFDNDPYSIMVNLQAGDYSKIETNSTALKTALDEKFEQIAEYVQRNIDGTRKIGRQQTLYYFQPHGYFNFGYTYLQDDPLWDTGVSHRGYEPTSCYAIRKKLEDDKRLQGIYKLWSTTAQVDNLIVLGVGTTALEQNLNKLKLQNIKHLKKVHFTCHKDEKMTDEKYQENLATYRNYFKETFKHIGLSDENIKEYNTCSELAARLFR